MTAVDGAEFHPQADTPDQHFTLEYIPNYALDESVPSAYLYVDRPRERQ
jgi:hypothetical protein